MVLAVHLCGALSCKAVDIFNENNRAIFLALKPCCLPGRQAVKQKLEWSLGRHSFTAAELYGIKSKRPGPGGASEAAKGTGEDALFAVLPSFSGPGSGRSSASSSNRDGGAAGEAVDGRRKRGHRTAAAQKRRLVKRKVRLKERNRLRDEARRAANKADPEGARGRARPQPAAAGQKEVTPEQAERTRQGGQLLKRFSNHLLKGLDMSSLLAGTAPCKLATPLPATALLEEVIVQKTHFQNLFLFAERPFAVC